MIPGLTNSQSPDNISYHMKTVMTSAEQGFFLFFQFFENFYHSYLQYFFYGLVIQVLQADCSRCQSVKNSLLADKPEVYRMIPPEPGDFEWNLN